MEYITIAEREASLNGLTTDMVVEASRLNARQIFGLGARFLYTMD